MFIKYNSITNPQDWLETIAHQFKVDVVKDKILLPKDIGKGFIKQYYPFSWLTVSFLKFKLHEPMEIVRKGVNNKPLVPIVFHLNESQQFIDKTLYNVGDSTANSIFMPSTDIDSKYILPAKKWITNITLTFDKKHIIDEFIEKDSYLYSLLTSGEPFYIFEPFTLELITLTQELEKEVSREKVNKLYFYSILMQLLDKFICTVNERKKVHIKSEIHAKDIDKLFKVRRILLSDVCSVPSADFLAQEAGMSKSKLQKSFKHVFGKSISQYTLFCKMKKAEKMLNTHKYSISEVGYTLGYTNLSHFSEIFKKHFNKTPTEFLNSKQRI